ncbi:MAG: hypothetical protein RR555_10770 [Bacteroidales bacterium]
MNEIFSYTRFGKLLKSDIVRYLPKYYGGMLIFLALLPATWVFKSFFNGSPMDAESRLTTFGIFLFFATFLAPFRIYGSTNHKKWGVDFTMLPASAFEKFLSMFLISTILIPIVFFLASYLIDIILTTIPTGAYYQYITLSDIFTATNLAFFGECILFASFALLGNMLFKKNKLSKTLLSLFALLVIAGFIVSSATYGYVRNLAYKTESGEVHRMINDEIIPDADTTKFIMLEQTQGAKSTAVRTTKEGKTYTLSSASITSELMNFLDAHDKALMIILQIIIYVVIPGLLYFFTFLRIKKQQL